MVKYASSAYIRQCFAIHPRDLEVRQVKGPRILIVCIPCRLRHIVSVETQAAASTRPDTSGPLAALAECLAAHSPKVAVVAVEVTRERISLVCSECARNFRWRLAGCETHLRDDPEPEG